MAVCKVEIYALCHPLTAEIRYIGKANDTSKRLASHVRDSRRRDTPVYRWIRKLAAEGLAPVAKVLEVCEGPWQEVETRLIAEHRGTHRLLNVALGGDEPCCPLEVRQANGRKAAAQIHSDPFKKYIWSLKRKMGEDLLFLKNHGKTEAYNRIVGKLRIAAQKAPNLFGSFAALEMI